MDITMLKDIHNLHELTTTETLTISGGNTEGTFADEIGYVIGSIWGAIVTSHRARARGQQLAHSQ